MLFMPTLNAVNHRLNSTKGNIIMARKLKEALAAALYGDPEASAPINLDGTMGEPEQATTIKSVTDKSYDLVGTNITLKFREDIGANSFLITSMLRGIASNLQFSRVSAEDKLDDMQAKAKARVETNEGTTDHPEQLGLTDAQQIFADALCEQLEFVEDLFEDLRTFWGSVNENPEFKLLSRPDVAVRRSMQESAARKLAQANSERTAGAQFGITDLETRRQAIAARRK